MRSTRPRHSSSYWSSRRRAKAEPLDVGADDLAAADAFLGDQAGPLEHCDVLLDRREAHGVVPGQLGDALAAAERPQDDVAPGGIGQRGEDVVGVEGRLSLIQPYGCISRLSGQGAVVLVSVLELD